MHTYDPGSEADEAWAQLCEIWRLAERVCRVQYSADLPRGIAGGYDMSGNRILIRSGTVPSGQDFPTRDDRDKMTYQACVVAHELSHAHSLLEGGKEFERYRRSLIRWNLAGMDGTVLSEADRGRIFDEEVRVELRGIKMVRSVAPTLEEAYLGTMASNLSAYSSLLWTGRWPERPRGSV